MSTKSEEVPDAFFEHLLDVGAKTPVDETSDFKIDLPPFYDAKKYDRARQFYADNRFAMFGGMLTGLLGLLSVPSILDILVETKNSYNALTAYRRYIATIFHTINWFRYEMTPGTPAWKSADTVRKIHLFSSRKCQQAGIGFISQKDMAFTQFAFMGYIVSRGGFLGVKNATQEDLDAFCHFWRVLGYMLGIKEEFNLCTDNIDTTLPRVDLVRTKIYIPFLEKPKDTFKPMVKAVIDGLWCFNPGLDFDAFIYFTFSIAGVPGYEYSLWGQVNDRVQKMGWYSRWILWMQCFMRDVMLEFYVIRFYHNHQLLVSEFLIRYFPFLAFYQFGVKESYVRI